MSDGGNTWQPPEPGAVPPPPPASGPAPESGGFAPPPGPPTAPVEVTPGPPEPAGRRSTGKVVAGVVGAVAIVLAGVFAITRFAGDAAAGGADSPEDAANAFLDAIDDEDVLGVIDVLLPGERETFRQPLQDFVSELRRLEVLSDDDLSDIGGVDLEVTEREIEVEETNVDDIVNLTITVSIGGTLDGESLPVGDWIRDAVGEDEIASIHEEAPPEEGTFPITAVRKDGRWYLSLFYTMAEAIRADLDVDIPEEGIEPNGGDSPEAAMDNFFTALADLDLEGMLGTLNPNEFEALQRYAPLFLDDAQAALDEIEPQIEITDTAYTVEGSGSTRSVTINAMTIEATNEGQTFRARFEDQCLVAEFEGDRLDLCDVVDDFSGQLEDELGGQLGEIEGLEELIDQLQETFADYEAPGIVVREVDGAWYLSPLATMSDQGLALMRALTREEIEDLTERLSEFNASLEAELQGGFEVPGMEDFELPEQFEPGTGDRPGGDDDPFGTDGSGEDETSAPLGGEACLGERRLADAAACFEELVSTGELAPELVPWYARHPECDTDELFWTGEYFTLDDEAFVATVDELAPCVQDLVASGAVGRVEVPGELLAPECLSGRNPYLLSESDEAYDEFVACLAQ